MIPTRLRPLLLLLVLTSGACNSAVDIEAEPFLRPSDDQADAGQAADVELEGDGGPACGGQQCPPVAGARFGSCDGDECIYICARGLEDRNGDLDLQDEGDGCECGEDDPSCGCVPSAEVCDGIDNDCDGQIDEADQDFVADACDDDVGVCAFARARCVEGRPVACEERDFVEGAERAGLSFTPMTAMELHCDGEDNNCDGRQDEQCCPEGMGFKDVIGVRPERLLFPTLSINPATPLTPLIAYQMTRGADDSVGDLGQARFSVINLLGQPAAEPVNPDVSFNGDTTSPSMAWDGRGHAMVWVRPLSDEDRKLIWARFDSTGSKIDGTRIINAQNQDDSLELVAMGSDGVSGASALAWVTGGCGTEATSCVKVQALNAEGEKISTSAKQGIGLLGQVGPPAVAVGPPGFITAWHDTSSDGVSSNIQWNVRSMTAPNLQILSQEVGGLEGIGTFALASRPPRADPAAAFFGDRFVLAFPDDEGESKVIRVGVINPEGDFIERLALGTGDDGLATNVRLLVRDGRLIVVWVEANRGVFSATLDGNYNIADEQLALLPEAGSRRSFPASSALAIGAVPIFGLLTGSSVKLDGLNVESLRLSLHNRDGDQLCLQP